MYLLQILIRVISVMHVSLLSTMELWGKTCSHQHFVTFWFPFAPVPFASPLLRHSDSRGADQRSLAGRLIFIHLRCWEPLPFLTIQRQRCIKFRVLRAQDFYTPLPLNCQKGQRLPAPEVYKNQSPTCQFGLSSPSEPSLQMLRSQRTACSSSPTTD